MYQLVCKISPDENQIITNEWTITVNWISLTSFQEISGNGERCKSVKHADAEPGDAAGDLAADRRDFASKGEKRMLNTLFFKNFQLFYKFYQIHRKIFLKSKNYVDTESENNFDYC